MITLKTLIIFTVLLLIVISVTAREYRKSKRKISSSCSNSLLSGKLNSDRNRRGRKNSISKVNVQISNYKTPLGLNNYGGRRHRKKISSKGASTKRPNTNGRRRYRGGRGGKRPRGGRVDSGRLGGGSGNRRNTSPGYFSINNDLPPYEPLFLRPGGNLDITGFLLPQSGDVVRLRPGQRVLLACPGAPNKPNRLLASNTEQLEVTAAGGTNFRLPDGSVSSISTLGCQQYPAHLARNTGRKCGRPILKYPIIEVGFLLPNNSKFYKLYEVCFDDKIFDTYYSLNLVIPEINGRKLLLPKPSFIQAGYYNGLKLKNLYTIDNQRQTLSKILNSIEIANAYIKPLSANCKGFYLVPGHLTPKTDFLYPSQQRASYWYLNTAPQFQTLNAGNWAALENSVRQFASTSRRQLLVYTGTHGVTTLLDMKGAQQPLYLSGDHSGRIRVPQHFWKVVVDPYTNKGVAFVSLNNPYYIESFDCKFKLCEDICDQISWIKWQPKNITAGFSYCCDVNDLSVYVNEIPDLHVTGLLT